MTTPHRSILFVLALTAWLPFRAQAHCLWLEAAGGAEARLYLDEDEPLP